MRDQNFVCQETVNACKIRDVEREGVQSAMLPTWSNFVVFGQKEKTIEKIAFKRSSLMLDP